MTYVPVVGHSITVTGGVLLGRAWFDCSCGISRIFASKSVAVQAALAHQNEIGGAKP